MPASGTGTNVTFSIMEDSTLTWLWETNVWTECTVSGDAAGSFAGWVLKDGSSVVVPFETDVKRYTVATSGDTAGVAVDMDAKTVTIPTDEPRTVSVAITEVVGTGPFPLSWSDPAGVAAWSMAEEPSAADGWCLRSDPVEARETAATQIEVDGPGKVEFDWMISANRGDYARVYVDGEASPRAQLSRATDWIAESVVVEGAGPHTVRWTYEKKSTAAAGADASFLDNVQWRPARTLAVSSVAGRTTPKTGTSTFYYGDEVEAAVAETAPPRGTRRTFLGWTGTGSVPASGTATNMTFGITEDSTLVWNWFVEHRIEFRPSGAVASDFESAWVREGETLVVPYRLRAGYDSLSLGGDSTGVTVDETARTLSIPADGPRTVTLRTSRAISLADALDAPAVSWSTDAGASTWLGQDTDTSDGEDAATSGVPSGEAGESILVATVEGPGALSWKWKLVADDSSGVEVFLDGESAAWLEEPTDWAEETLEIDGDGSHEVQFVFWNTGSAAGDHASMDRVVWTGATATAETGATPAPVPHSWLRANGLAADGNYDGAAFAAAANGLDDVWQCYVSGIDPTDPAARFRATISMVDGEPVVLPDPDLGAARDYEIQGKESLDDYDWAPAGAESRFFRVRIAIPEAAGYTITFDSAGGSAVASIAAAYGAAVTAPAAPTRAGYDFAGWSPAFPATMPLGGAILTAQWTPKNYTITFDSAGGSAVASITAAYGATLTEPAAPTKDRCTFAGWSPAFPATMPLGGATLVAQWTQLVPDADWFVDAANGSDANDGRSWDAAFATIQAAIDAAAAGDAILVADGTYAPIQTRNKEVEIRSENGPENCIIDGGGTQRCANLSCYANSASDPGSATFAANVNGSLSSKLVGFTLRNGRATGADSYLASGGGVLGGRSEGCIVEDCRASGVGGGIAWGEHERDIVRNCSAGVLSAALAGGWSNKAKFRSCLVYGCDGGTDYAGRGQVVGEAQFFECTIDASGLASGRAVFDSGDAYNCAILGTTLHAGETLYAYDCVYTATSVSGVSASSCKQVPDLGFLDAANRDYRLAAGSPCIDAGDSSNVAETVDLDGNPRIAGTAVDAGCHERP